MLVCVNATTGNITWTLNGGVFPAAAANGYVIGSGINDGNLYCVGKGKTQTTVTAPLTAVSVNSEVVIQGTVMDMSQASAKDYSAHYGRQKYQANTPFMQHLTEATPTGVPMHQLQSVQLKPQHQQRHNQCKQHPPIHHYFMRYP